MKRETSAGVFHHPVALIGLFILGNLIISFPKGQGQNEGLTGFLACLLISLLLCVVTARLPSCTPAFGTRMLADCKHRVWAKLLTVLLLAFCFICYANCCLDYIRLVDEVRLPQTHTVVIAVLFLALTAFFAQMHRQMTDIFCLVSLLAVVLIAVGMLLLSLPDMDSELFVSGLGISASGTFRQGLSFYVHSFGQLIFPILYIGFQDRKSAFFCQTRGLLCGGGVFLICLLQVLFLLGSGVLNRVSFPYAAATGSITLGNAYSRMDGWTYYLYFVCSFLKASVILTVSADAANALFGWRRWIPCTVLAVVTLITVVWPVSRALLLTDATTGILLAFELFLPIALYLTGRHMSDH